MSMFIPLANNEGLINLDHAVRSRSLEKGLSSLFDDRGESLGKVYTDSIPEGEVIPAAPGLFATVITVFAYDEQPPEVSDQRYPIVGWRVLRGVAGSVAFPIIPDDVVSNQMILVELPDGALCSPEDEVFESLESAKDLLLRRAKNERSES